MKYRLQNICCRPIKGLKQLYTFKVRLLASFGEMENLLGYLWWLTPRSLPVNKTPLWNFGQLELELKSLRWLIVVCVFQTIQNLAFIFYSNKQNTMPKDIASLPTKHCSAETSVLLVIRTTACVAVVQNLAFILHSNKQITIVCHINTAVLTRQYYYY